MRLHIRKAGKVALHYFLRRYTCPELDHTGKILLGNGVIRGKDTQPFNILLFCGYLGFHFKKTFIVGVFGVIHHLLLPGIKKLQTVFSKLKVADALVSQVRTGTGLIEQINSLVRQKTVIYIALRKHHSTVDKRIAYRHLVEIFIIVLYSDKHLVGFLNGGLLDFYRLETAFKRRVLLYIFSIFREGSGTDYLNLTP